MMKKVAAQITRITRIQTAKEAPAMKVMRLLVEILVEPPEEFLEVTRAAVPAEHQAVTLLILNRMRAKAMKKMFITTPMPK